MLDQMVLELLQKKLFYSDQSEANTVEMKKAEVHRSRKRIKEERKGKERNFI